MRIGGRGFEVSWAEGHLGAWPFDPALSGWAALYLGEARVQIEVERRWYLRHLLKVWVSEERGAWVWDGLWLRQGPLRSEAALEKALREALARVEAAVRLGYG